jgi:hypothetical protein
MPTSSFADADTDVNVKAVKVLLHQSTPEWQDWHQKHVSRLPELQAHIAALEQQQRTSSAVDRWVKGNRLRYLQRPLHHLGKDMIDALAPGGPLPEQHASGALSLRLASLVTPLIVPLYGPPAQSPQCGALLAVPKANIVSPVSYYTASLMRYPTKLLDALRCIISSSIAKAS